MGQNRYFTDQLCPALQAFMDQPCGCFFMTAPTPVAQPTSWSVSTPTGQTVNLGHPSPIQKPPVQVPAPVPVPKPIALPTPNVGWSQPAPTAPQIGWGSPKHATKGAVCGMEFSCINRTTGQAGFLMHGFSSWGCYDSCRPLAIDSSSMKCGLCE